MELNGALWNPLQSDKGSLTRLHKRVRELRRQEVATVPESLRPRRKLIGAAAEEIVRGADSPLRVADICAELRAQGRNVHTASVRKALHDRSRGPAPRLQRVGRGLYTASVGGVSYDHSGRYAAIGKFNFKN